MFLSSTQMNRISASLVRASILRIRVLLARAWRAWCCLNIKSCTQWQVTVRYTCFLSKGWQPADFCNDLRTGSHCMIFQNCLCWRQRTGWIRFVVGLQFQSPVMSEVLCHQLVQPRSYKFYPHFHAQRTHYCLITIHHRPIKHAIVIYSYKYL